MYSPEITSVSDFEKRIQKHKWIQITTESVLIPPIKTMTQVAEPWNLGFDKEDMLLEVWGVLTKNRIITRYKLLPQNKQSYLT